MNRRHIVFAVIALGTAALNAGAIRQLVDLALRDSTASHLIVVPFVTAALVYRRRDTVYSRQADCGAGTLASLAAATAFAWAMSFYWRSTHPVDALTATLAALAWTWAAAFIAAYGAASARAALFPLAFLAFMVPLPDAVLTTATAALKRGSADCVAALFTLTGTPFHRQDFVFDLPSFSIEIADECSGIRSSIALFLTALLAGDALLTRRTTKILLALAVLPFAILKNGVRIVALTLLSMHVDRGFLTGQLHHEGGIVFFVIAIGLMTPFLAMLARWDRATLHVSRG